MVIELSFACLFLCCQSRLFLLPFYVLNLIVFKLLKNLVFFILKQTQVIFCLRFSSLVFQTFRLFAKVGTVLFVLSKGCGKAIEGIGSGSKNWHLLAIGLWFFVHLFREIDDEFSITLPTARFLFVLRFMFEYIIWTVHHEWTWFGIRLFFERISFVKMLRSNTLIFTVEIKLFLF